MSQMIRSKLAAAKAKHSLVASGTGIAQAVVFFIAWIAGMMIFDWAAELPWWLRFILLLLGLGGVGYILYRSAIKPVIKAPDVEALALKVEGAEPQFRTRLIAAIQFGALPALPAGASPSLVRVTLEEADQIAAPLNFSRVIKTDTFLKTMGAAILVLIVGLVIAFAGGDRLQNLLQRAFLSTVDLFTRTRVYDLTQVTKVAQGDTVILTARTEGTLVDSGRVMVRFGKGKTIPYPILPTKDDKSVFSTPIPSVQENFSYMIRINDGHTQWKTIEVKTRPAAKQTSYEIKLPAYTGLDNIKSTGAGGLTVLPGSQVTVNIQSTKTLASPGTVVRRHILRKNEAGSEVETIKEYEMKVGGGGGDKASATVDIVEGTAKLTVQLYDAEGITNKEAAVCPILIATDEAPMARITRPERKKILATKAAVVNVEYYAQDDFRLGSVVLKYRVDEGPEITVDSGIPANALPNPAAGEIKWDLAKVQVPVDAQGLPTKPAIEGSNIEFWIEARDTNTQLEGGQPSVGKSDKHMVTIVTKAEKQAELMSQLGESMTQIQGVKESQESASRDLENALTGGAQTQPSTPQK
jgi:hypothetical protein